MNSVKKLQTSSIHDQNSQHNMSQQNMPTSAPNNIESQQPATRVISAESLNEQEQKQKLSITEILHEKIQTLSMKDENNEISMLRVENDMVTTFFDNIDKFSDHFVTTFIEGLRKDIDSICLTIFSSTNELAIFCTYLVMLIRKLNNIYSLMQFIK